MINFDCTTARRPSPASTDLHFMQKRHGYNRYTYFGECFDIYAHWSRTVVQKFFFCNYVTNTLVIFCIRLVDPYRFFTTFPHIKLLSILLFVCSYAIRADVWLPSETIQCKWMFLWSQSQVVPAWNISGSIGEKDTGHKTNACTRDPCARSLFPYNPI